MLEEKPVFPWLTVIVCATCAIWFAVAASGVPLPWVTGAGAVRFSDPLHIVGLGARSTPLVADTGESWRILSCHFVHTSALHLAFNLAFLFSVGAAIEQVVWRTDFAALLLLTAIASSLGSLLGTPQISAGASGLVFGALGAAVTLGLRHHHRLGRRVRRYFGLWVLPFLLVLFGFGIGNPSVDQASHLGGLLSGLVLGGMVELRVQGRNTMASLVIAVLVALAALLAAPIIAQGGRPPQRFQLPSGLSMELPGRWTSHLAAPNQLDFSTAGGLVQLRATRQSATQAAEACRYLRQYLDEGGESNGKRTSVLTCSEAEVLQLRGRTVIATQFQFRRGDIPKMGEIDYVVAEPREPWVTVLVFETPLTWHAKYRTTRRRILRSLESSSKANTPPPVSVAALQ